METQGLGNVTVDDRKAPVTDDERARITEFVTTTFKNEPSSEAIGLTGRDIFVMMTMLKEQQDSLYDIAQGSV